MVDLTRRGFIRAGLALAAAPAIVRAASLMPVQAVPDYNANYFTDPDAWFLPPRYKWRPYAMGFVIEPASELLDDAIARELRAMRRRGRREAVIHLTFDRAFT